MKINNKNYITSLIANTFNTSNHIALIIYKWYDVEDAWDDFETPEEFILYMRRDIYSMIDACDDEDEKDMVSEAIGYRR